MAKPALSFLELTFKKEKTVRLSRKLAIAAVSTVAAVSAATAAFAFWTTSGSGTGSASTETRNGNGITVNQRVTLAAMYPGDSPQSLKFNLQNNDAHQTLRVAGVSVAVTDVTRGIDGQGHPISIVADCAAGNFSIVQPLTGDVAREVAASTTSADITSGSIQFNDLPSTNQDACQGASVVLTYTAS